MLFRRIVLQKAKEEALPEATAPPEHKGPSKNAAQWIRNLHISSVMFRGDNSRMVIDGRVYTLGSVISLDHRLRWVKVDARNHWIYFQDANGNVYRKKQ